MRTKRRKKYNKKTFRKQSYNKKYLVKKKKFRKKSYRKKNLKGGAEIDLEGLKEVLRNFPSTIYTVTNNTNERIYSKEEKLVKDSMKMFVAFIEVEKEDIVSIIKEIKKQKEELPTNPDPKNNKVIILSITNLLYILNIITINLGGLMYKKDGIDVYKKLKTLLFEDVDNIIYNCRVRGYKFVLKDVFYNYENNLNLLNSDEINGIYLQSKKLTDILLDKLVNNLEKLKELLEMISSVLKENYIREVHYFSTNDFKTNMAQACIILKKNNIDFLNEIMNKIGEPDGQVLSAELAMLLRRSDEVFKKADPVAINEQNSTLSKLRSHDSVPLTNDLNAAMEAVKNAEKGLQTETSNDLIDVTVTSANAFAGVQSLGIYYKELTTTDLIHSDILSYITDKIEYILQLIPVKVTVIKSITECNARARAKAAVAAVEAVPSDQERSAAGTVEGAMAARKRTLEVADSLERGAAREANVAAVEKERAARAAKALEKAKADNKGVAYADSLAVVMNIKAAREAKAAEAAAARAAAARKEADEMVKREEGRRVVEEAKKYNFKNFIGFYTFYVNICKKK